MITNQQMAKGIGVIFIIIASIYALIFAIRASTPINRYETVVVPYETGSYSGTPEKRDDQVYIVDTKTGEYKRIH